MHLADPAPLSFCATQYILPTNTLDLASLTGPLQGVQCWSAWNAHSPDRFDMFSAGESIPCKPPCIDVYPCSPLIEVDRLKGHLL
mmetsp:Transcript_3402/g.9767  ORF Transcript_3402/g.9767 Transcript_3402/m.9767 type:complete len:85 (+) Transcript_3402:1169-1423(+)